MFNHESPRRGEEFVTRRVTRAVARIAAGLEKEVVLGRVAPRRDWGWAPEYMAALPLIAARDEPDDFVLATGVSHSVEEWCEAAFGEAALDYRDYLRCDPVRFRPAEVDYLQGDAGKAKRLLGWEATVGFAEIVKRMVAADQVQVAFSS
jgi:GDPmannose 4,6-dehydratase